MRSARGLATLAGLGLPLAVATSAQADPQLRKQIDQAGDFVLFGNTLAYECRSTNPAVPDPLVGSADCARNSSINDSAPDIFWRSDSPEAGEAQASVDITAEQARSTAVLSLPEGAKVTYARMYWAGYLESGGADETARIERIDTDLDAQVTADQSWTVDDQGGTFWYQATADVTEIVAAAGAGAYRVSGASTVELPDLDDEHPIAAWSMVVFYTLDGDTPRNLALFDGFDFVNSEENPTVTIAGFVVPDAGYDAKLGVVTYEGDARWDGDGLTFNGEALSDPPTRPEDNFFNGSRTYLGTTVSIEGDLPQLTGEANSLNGVDMAVIDVENLVQAGDTSATISAVSSRETYLLGLFVTSISTFKPNFATSGKTLTDLNAGGIAPGDELEYTITGVNTGNDRSVGTLMTDALPKGITFVPGSIEITTGPNAGEMTDEAGDDQAEYDEGTRTVTVRLGTGADASDGGVIEVDESTTITFRVTVDAEASGTISNQAVITASGEQGASESEYPTDGNADNPGTPPTEGEVGTSNDSDSDGLTDDEEADLGTLPDDADSDDDGVPDGDEPQPGQDADDDGKINALDPDSDDDGLADGTELGLDCSNDDTDADAGFCVPDGDDGNTVTDPLDDDTDGGGVPDGAEDADKNGVLDDGETDPTAGHGDDDSVIDTDGDGLSDAEEADIGTDPNDADSDDDGVPDGDEPRPRQDTDGDDRINALDPDSDDDGLADGTELGLDCSEDDTDVEAGFCVPDGDDGNTVTDPLDDDTDKGGVSDGDEDTNKNGVVDTGERDPSERSDDAPEGGQGGAAGAAAQTGGAAPSADATAGATPTGGAAPSTGGAEETGGTVLGEGGSVAPDAVLEGGGCSCSAPGRGSSRLGALALLAGSVGLLRSRRRRP